MFKIYIEIFVSRATKNETLRCIIVRQNFGQVNFLFKSYLINLLDSFKLDTVLTTSVLLPNFRLDNTGLL